MINLEEREALEIILEKLVKTGVRLLWQEVEDFLPSVPSVNNDIYLGEVTYTCTGETFYYLITRNIKAYESIAASTSTGFTVFNPADPADKKVIYLTKSSTDLIYALKAVLDLIEIEQG
ncbi:MAG: hypothetical protein KatS3mg087_0500 [Patescibacteria group bacterium]|nr:MAG: hypothetical protein KatS3mg087_0500 [Patescibacteria group bacterium]